MTSEQGPGQPGKGETRAIGRDVVYDIANLLAAAMANARSIRRHATEPERVADLASQVESQALRALKLIEEAVADQRASE